MTGAQRLGSEQYFSNALVTILDQCLLDAWGQCLRLTSPSGEFERVYQWPSGIVLKLLDYRTLPATVGDVKRVALRLKGEHVDLLKQRAWVLPRAQHRHWTAIVVDFRAKLVLFVDSLRSSETAVVTVSYTHLTLPTILRV